ncbi:MAG: hypothetical protein ACUZ8E_07665 [Candidatus Anammoxibacter sp.]
MFTENVTFKIPKKIIDSLRRDLKLPGNTSNISVLRKAIAVSSFSANNGALEFKDAETLLKVGNAKMNIDNIT